jgi:hypothetical protein
MHLYADEDFPYPVVETLRLLGHDVLTVQEDGRTATPDAGVLARAHQLGRAVLTYNRADFERLHRQGAAHGGIASAKKDDNFPALADRIHAALTGRMPGRWCIRVNRPSKP